MKAFFLLLLLLLPTTGLADDPALQAWRQGKALLLIRHALAPGSDSAGPAKHTLIQIETTCGEITGYVIATSIDVQVRIMQTKVLNTTTVLRSGGLAVIGMALCYISVAVIFLGLLSVPSDIDTLSRIRYLQQEYHLVASGYGIGYLLFGVLLAILLQALQQALPNNQSAIAGLADRFGNVWVMLMMAAGMAALIGLDMTFRLVDSAPEQALALYHSRNLITEALGGGIELVGGLWVLLFSIAGLQQQRFAKALHLLGLVVGSLGILTVLHNLPHLKEAFGITQLIWFSWLGVALLGSGTGKHTSSALS